MKDLNKYVQGRCYVIATTMVAIYDNHSGGVFYGYYWSDKPEAAEEKGTSFHDIWEQDKCVVFTSKEEATEKVKLLKELFKDIKRLVAFKVKKI
jgi:hypothetical protein